MKVLRTFLIWVIVVAVAGLAMATPGWRDRLRRVDWRSVAMTLFDEASAWPQDGERSESKAV